MKSKRNELVKNIEFILTQPFFDNDLAVDSIEAVGIGAPIHVKYYKNDSNLFIITGENATGKSFFLKQLRGKLKMDKIKLFYFSIISRATGMYGGYGEHSFNLIPEEIASNGENTSILLTNGLEGVKEIKEKCVLLLDEPSLGFSHGYQKAVAEYLFNFVQEQNKYLLGLVVVEQNKNVLSKLSTLNHAHIRFGDDKNINEVLEQEYIYSAEDILKLRDKSKEIRHGITKMEKAITEYNKTH